MIVNELEESVTMAFDVLFQPTRVDVPTVATLKNRWRRIPDARIRTHIAREHHYLLFHEQLLARIHYTRSQEQLPAPLELTLRAGLVKAAVLIAASICEAALRAHGEQRQLRDLMRKQPHQRTFGVILKAWQNEPDVQSIWNDLKSLHERRNNVHLFVAASQSSGHYQQINTEEVAMLATAKSAMQALMQLRSP